MHIWWLSSSWHSAFAVANTPALGSFSNGFLLWNLVSSPPKWKMRLRTIGYDHRQSSHCEQCCQGLQPPNPSFSVWAWIGCRNCCHIKEIINHYLVLAGRWNLSLVLTELGLHVAGSSLGPCSSQVKHMQTVCSHLVSEYKQKLISLIKKSPVSHYVKHLDVQGFNPVLLVDTEFREKGFILELGHLKVSSVNRMLQFVWRWCFCCFLAEGP